MKKIFLILTLFFMFCLNVLFEFFIWYFVSDLFHHFRRLFLRLDRSESHKSGQFFCSFGRFR